MIAAVTHGYPGLSGWSMGGEVSLHRTLTALNEPVTVLTRTPKPYVLDGITVQPITIADVLNIDADPTPLVWQLAKLDATTVIAQNELSAPAVKAAHTLGIPAIVSIHTPPRYGRHLREAVRTADAVIMNTHQSAQEWRHPRTFVLHPPISALPPKPRTPTGTHYTLLSNLHNKGVRIVLELASRMPDKRFLIVRSPAEITHGIEGFNELAAALPNVTVKPRVSPERVHEYLAPTRILLVPSKMETYGLSAIEAAGYGIPTVGITNMHVAEGISDAQYGTSPLNVDETAQGIATIEAGYATWSTKARARAEAIMERQTRELTALPEWINAIRDRHTRRG
jgi:hypothetical protein